MLAESGGNPTRINDNPRTGDYSVGMFQINLFGANAKYRPSADWLQNPVNNISYAAAMWKYSGWHPWTTYTSGSYLKYL